MSPWLSLLKYAAVTTDMLTPVIVGDIVKVITSRDVPVDNKLFNEIVESLKADDVDRLADIAQKPELVSRLKTLIESRDSAIDDNMIICPHCGEYFSS